MAIDLIGNKGLVSCTGGGASNVAIKEDTNYRDLRLTSKQTVADDEVVSGVFYRLVEDETRIGDQSGPSIRGMDIDIRRNPVMAPQVLEFFHPACD